MQQQQQLADLKIQQQRQRRRWQQQKHLQVGCYEQLQENSSSCTTPSALISRPLAPTFASKSPETKSSSSLIHPHALKRSEIPAAEPSLFLAPSSGGTTRWNPSVEQIRALEVLYREGMRTPNARQIEHITQELSKHGRIEGKNVFYWFQNHKARDRQKQKRTALLLALSPNTSTGGDQRDEDYHAGRSKRRCRVLFSGTTTDDGIHTENKGDYAAAAAADETLELFPLHPEGKKRMTSVQLIKEGFN